MPRYREKFAEQAGDLGFFEPGQLNAITDVPGVKVGHATVFDPARGFYTGVTAIWPREDVYSFRPRASGHIVHGAGEMTGLHQVVEWGVIETPILLTSCLNVGKVYDETITYLAERHPQMGLEEDVLIPVVAECDDSQLNRARERPVGAREVRAALDLASSGPVAEGSVGAGTGMMAYGLKGGIGTASRRISVGKGPSTRECHLGVLVNANFGYTRHLPTLSREEAKRLEERLEKKKDPRSIIIVLATDAPLRPDQLRRLSQRAGLALGRAGSFAGHGSGELVIGFSTTLGEPRAAEGPWLSVENLHDSFLNPFYEATVEAVHEAILNALTGAGTVEGRDGHIARGFLELIESPR